MEVIGWLNSNSGAIIALATVVLVFITGFYAWATKNILEENRQMRVDAQKPEINVDLCSYMVDGHTHVDLYVENLGGGPAYNVEFTVDPSFELSDKRTLGEVIFLSTGIRRLAQGRKKTHRLGRGSQLSVGKLKETPLEIGVTYRNKVGQKDKEHFSLDFREHFGI